MASRYRRIDPRIWSDEAFASLPTSEKLIGLYVITAQSNRIGLFVFSPGKAIEDLKMLPRVFRAGFRHVLQVFGWQWDEPSRVLYIDTWWKYNPPENANNVVGNLKDLEDLPANPFLKPFSENLTFLDSNLHETFTQTFAKHSPKRSPKRSPERSLERSPTQEQEQEQEQESPLPPKGAQVSAGELPAPEEIQKRWNAIPGVKHCKSLGPTIRDRIRTRLKEHPDQGWWEVLFQQVRASDFLSGRTNGAKGSFNTSLEWILRPRNLDKLLAGDYDPVPANGQATVTLCTKRIQRPGDRFLRPCGKLAAEGGHSSEPRCAEHSRAQPFAEATP